MYSFWASRLARCKQWLVSFFRNAFVSVLTFPPPPPTVCIQICTRFSRQRQGRTRCIGFAQVTVAGTSGLDFRDQSPTFFSPNFFFSPPLHLGQTKKIEMVLEKQFGSKLSTASPVYQKTAAVCSSKKKTFFLIHLFAHSTDFFFPPPAVTKLHSHFHEQKLIKKGHDVTKGDAIDVRVHFQYVSFVDHVHRSSTQLVVESVIFHNIATTEPDGFNVVCLIVDDDAGIICHALRLEAVLAARLIEVLEKVVCLLLRDLIFLLRD